MFRRGHKLLLLAALVCGGEISAELIDGEELVDPTEPFDVNYVVETSADGLLDMISTIIPKNYDVSFIRAGSKSSMAVVNGENVSVGDLIGDVKVVAIDRGGVTLMINEEERRVGLSGTNIKSTGNN
ncbi:MAG: hypothetical protein HQ498_07385 [Pseudohongiella sp.]|nr:hypothetical protein [Pseudohongiella sp.]